MAARLRTLEAIDGRGTDVCGTAVPRTQTILSGMAPDGEIIRLRFVQPYLGERWGARFVTGGGGQIGEGCSLLCTR